MPTILKTKNSVTTTVVPTTLQQGELAVNITDKKLWVGNAATTPVQLLGAGVTGDVVGPASATDNAVARFDGTTGKIIQNSAVTIADTTGDITTAGYLITAAGAVGTPALTTTGDTNTGIFFPAADTIAFTEGGAESMRIDSSGNVLVGTTTANSAKFAVNAVPNSTIGAQSAFITGSKTAFAGVNQLPQGQLFVYDTNSTAGSGGAISFGGNAGSGQETWYAVIEARKNNATPGDYGASMVFYTRPNNATADERMRITSSGNLLVATASSDVADANGTGASFSAAGNAQFSRASGGVMNVNRKTDDGVLVYFQQDASSEGTISVSGTTVSYNGGHLSRWSQLPNGSKDDTILKGTVLSNLDDMCVWEKNGVVADNEQLNKMKVSDVEGDTNVAGVFVNWTKDEKYDVDDMNVAMTGDMIIRIADGVVVQKGDLLMSAGDGTAMPQGDDIVRSKTIAKVTSNYVTCTYADGSYCVPCVLMAC
jgi:hypothetical protein